MLNFAITGFTENTISVVINDKEYDYELKPHLIREFWGRWANGRNQYARNKILADIKKHGRVLENESL